MGDGFAYWIGSCLALDIESGQFMRHLPEVINQILHVEGISDKCRQHLEIYLTMIEYQAPEELYHYHWHQVSEILERTIGVPRKPWEREVRRIFSGSEKGLLLD